MDISIIEHAWIARHIAHNNITIYPYILLVDDLHKSYLNRAIHHEWVHVLQIREMGWLNFYSHYLWEYVTGLIKYRNSYSAYMHVSFEIEAYHKMLYQVLPEVLK